MPKRNKVDPRGKSPIKQHHPYSRKRESFIRFRSSRYGGASKAERAICLVKIYGSIALRRGKEECLPLHSPD